jgi:alpha-L-rhamnosidase
MRPYFAMFVSALCLLWAVGSAPAFAQGGNVRDLKCENEINPRGVKSEHPRLSWSWAAAAPPRAYQILVASSEEKLRANEADLWDSGQVRTDKKTAEYQGKPLSSFQHCYWKIRVWSDYDTPGFYTESANWQMALLPFGEPETK